MPMLLVKNAEVSELIRGVTGGNVVCWWVSPPCGKILGVVISWTNHGGPKDRHPAPQ
jgi:hypothetical protein